MPGSPFVHALRATGMRSAGHRLRCHCFAYFDIGLTELWRAALPAGYRQIQEAGIDGHRRGDLPVPCAGAVDDELAAALTVSGLNGLARWWCDNQDVPREAVVATAMDLLWSGISSLRRGGPFDD